MPLVTLKELLKDAQEKKYAVGGFIVWNMEYIQGVIQAAEELKAPVIIMIGPVEIKYAGKYGIETLANMVLFAINKTKIPVALHFDHSQSKELIKDALSNGFSSVMFDGSRLTFDENISITRSIVELARKKGVSVEGEVGVVGGLEGDRNIPEDEAYYTSVIDAKRFIDETKVDALAVAIGTTHGLYNVKPRLDIQRLKEIRREVQVPLVLHGGSDTPAEMIKSAIKEGICKVNIATELKLAYAKANAEVFKDNENEYDPRVFLGAGRNGVKELVKEKIILFGSNGRC